MVAPVESPIVSIPIGEEPATIRLWQRLLEEGVYVNIMVPPACPPDACLLRASCSAAHSPEEIDRAAVVIARGVRAAGIRHIARAETPVEGD